jgi:hypothetical protein
MMDCFSICLLLRYEAEGLASQFKSVSGRHYVLHDEEKLTEKYISA